MFSFVERLLRQWSSRKYNLASYIKIEEGQVFFNLDEEALRKINQMRVRGLPLYLPYPLRLCLLRHALLHIGATTSNKKKKDNICLLPGLTFYTCYSDAQEERNLEHVYLTPSMARKRELLRSLISPDGDIFNQICSSALQHPYFLEISATHHWLTTQLLNHLHSNFNWIPRALDFFVAGISIYKGFSSLYSICHKGFLVKLLWQPILSLVFPLLVWCLWILLKPSIIRWALARIL